MVLRLNERMRRWVDIALPVLSGILLGLTFQLEMHYLVWMAVAPLLLMIRRSGAWRSFLSSFAAGFLFYGMVLWWLLSTGGVNPYNFSLLVISHAFFIALFGLSTWYFQKRCARWTALTLPAAWILLEYIRTHMGSLSTPWAVLGYSQYNVLPVARISAFAGVYGVSFLIIAVNTVLAETIYPFINPSRSRHVRNIQLLSSMRMSLIILSVVLVSFSSSFLYALPLARDNENPPGPKVAAVQGGQPLYEYANRDNDPGHVKSIFDTYLRLSRDASESATDLIVWPSSSVPGKLPQNKSLVRTLSGLAQGKGVFLLVGSSGYDKFDLHTPRSKRHANSVFLFSREGEILDQYDKVRLVPFNEYIPMRDYFKWPSWIISEDMIDSQPGEKLTVFNMDGLKFGVQICWENLFADQFRELALRGVDFMVSMTNEGFVNEGLLGVQSAHHHMLAINAFRAIENHVFIVRTAPTGVSGVIGPDGRITRIQDKKSNDIGVEGYMVSEIDISSERTFYTRYGDWLVFASFVLLTGFISVSEIGPKLKGVRSHKDVDTHSVT